MSLSRSDRNAKWRAINKALEIVEDEVRAIILQRHGVSAAEISVAGSLLVSVVDMRESAEGMIKATNPEKREE